MMMDFDLCTRFFPCQCRVGDELKDGIARFYDESSEIWEEVWGEHMHHGYYYTGKETDHKKAQVRRLSRARDQEVYLYRRITTHV